MKTLVLIVFAVVFYACESGTSSNSNTGAPPSGTPPPANTGETGGKPPEFKGPPTREDATPRNVREFFDLLPEEYFVLENCDRGKDKGCKKAREEYLKMLPSVVDIPNGYLQGGCDGGQACITMAIFRRPDGTHLVGVNTTHELDENNYFLDYSGGKWRDVSREAVPEFDEMKTYELPRKGTTVQVYEKKVVDRSADGPITERGGKLYELSWKDGKFQRVR